MSAAPSAWDLEQRTGQPRDETDHHESSLACASTNHCPFGVFPDISRSCLVPRLAFTIWWIRRRESTRSPRHIDERIARQSRAVDGPRAATPPWTFSRRRWETRPVAALTTFLIRHLVRNMRFRIYSAAANCRPLRVSAPQNTGGSFLPRNSIFRTSSKFVSNPPSFKGRFRNAAHSRMMNS